MKILHHSEAPQAVGICAQPRTAGEALRRPLAVRVEIADITALPNGC